MIFVNKTHLKALYMEFGVHNLASSDALHRLRSYSWHGVFGGHRAYRRTVLIDRHVLMYNTYTSYRVSGFFFSPTPRTSHSSSLYIFYLSLILSLETSCSAVMNRCTCRLSLDYRATRKMLILKRHLKP